MLTCHHLNLTERNPDGRPGGVSFYCDDCRSIVGTWDLPASHRRTIRYLPITTDCSPSEHLTIGAAS
jgi:hypothetical protein